jgi:hypothetical protein
MVFNGNMTGYHPEVESSIPSRRSILIGVVVMSVESFEKIMSYLDIIELELNKVAKIVGHDDFETWRLKTKKNKIKHS